MAAMNESLDKFAALDAQVVGVSVDSLPSHIAWQKHDIGAMRFPLCSDFYPHGAVLGQYGVLRDGPPIPGMSERAIFIVDKGGRIAFSRLYHLGEMPDLEEVFAALRELPQSRAATRGC